MNDRKKPRFLILRLSHIGDCLLTLPLVSELRRQYPDCQIVWVSEEASAELLRLHPAIDEVVTVPKKWFFHLSNWQKVRQKLRPYKFDVSFDPQSLLKSSLAGFLSGARNRLGFRGEHGLEFSTILNNRLIKPRASHLAERTMELLQMMNLPQAIGPLQMHLPLSRLASEEVEPFLRSLNTSQFCVINPGASWPSKRWESERFGHVAKHLFLNRNVVSVVAWAGTHESILADEIVKASDGAAIKAPTTSLPSLAVLLSKAMFFVGCDTGPMHLAVAAGTPCIGLYGPTRPEDSGAFGPQNIAIQKWHQSGTRRERRSGNNLAMQAIQVSDVIEACDQMLSRFSTRRQVDAA